MGESKQFKVGDQVTWKSQAHGFTKTKTGVVSEVVPPQCRPNLKFRNLYRGYGCGMGRSGISYVVTVGKVAYWPVKKNLALLGRL